MRVGRGFAPRRKPRVGDLRYATRSSPRAYEERSGLDQAHDDRARFPHGARICTTAVVDKVTTIFPGCQSTGSTTTTMTTIILHDEVAALEAERDLLPQLAKARHHKKLYEEMTSEEYRAALNKLGPSFVGSAEHLGLSRRQSQRYAHGTSPVADRSRSSSASTRRRNS